MTVPSYTIRPTHISDIHGGDTVEVNGKLRTVSRGDLKRKTFMGDTLWGDCYRLGTIPVRLALIEHAKPAAGANP